MYVGTDRKITYWDAFDGQAIRILEGSETEQVSALAIDHDGDLIVSGGYDKSVKVRMQLPLRGRHLCGCQSMQLLLSGRLMESYLPPGDTG